MAEAKLQIVKQKIGLLQNAIDEGQHVEVKKAELLAKNKELKEAVKKAIAELTTLETANGKVQVGLPSTGSSPKVSQAASPKVEKKTQAPSSPKIDAKKQAEQKAKKEAKKAAKNTNKKAPATDKPISLSRVKLIVGKITDVSVHPDADGLYVEKMECGEAEPRQVISGLVKHVPIDQMKNRKVCMIANLKPAKMRGILSYGMVLCAKMKQGDAEKVELIRVPDCAKPGDVITTEDFLGDNWDEPDLPQMNPKKKIFEQVQVDFLTDENKVATWKGKPFLVKGKEAETKGKFVSDTIVGGGIS